MGNKAIITDIEKKIGVYLHWNGGRDSVEAFLKYCELKGFRGFNDEYGKARFCQIVGNFFGGGLSLGITTSVNGCEDNGVYIVDGWEIVGREDFKGEEKCEYNLQEMLTEIDKRQPRNEQLGEYTILLMLEDNDN